MRRSRALKCTLVVFGAVLCAAGWGCSGGGDEQPVTIIESSDDASGGPDAESSGEDAFDPPDVEGSECPCPTGSYCDLSTETCKQGCIQNSNCPSGTYCNEEVRTCEQGCRMGDCGEGASCSSETRECECNVGRHYCDGECVASDSTDHCGSSCSPCPSPDNGRATCDGTSCGIECDSGYLQCGDSCVTQSDFCSQCADRAGSLSCDDDVDCCSGYRCVDGECAKALGGSCSGSPECAGETVCRDGSCCSPQKGPCREDSDCCNGDATCVAGECSLPPSTRCQTDDQCGAFLCLPDDRGDRRCCKTGGSCTSDLECCDTDCNNGRCCGSEYERCRYTDCCRDQNLTCKRDDVGEQNCMSE